MTLKLDANAPGGLGNAAFLAVACDLAYYNESQGSALFREKLGLDAKLISGENTQVYVCESETAIVAAFRDTYGSHQIRNIDIQKKIAEAGYDTEKELATDEAYNKLVACCRYRKK